MPDPRLVSRAQRAATMLERAWERWRATQGLEAEPMPPVSSYVGYSIEEPWGRPRVVFGVNAEDAERLAALLQESVGYGPDGLPRPADPGYRTPAPGGFAADRAAVPDRGYPDPGYPDRGYDQRRPASHGPGRDIPAANRVEHHRRVADRREPRRLGDLRASPARRDAEAVEALEAVQDSPRTASGSPSRAVRSSRPRSPPAPLPLSASRRLPGRPAPATPRRQRPRLPGTPAPRPARPDQSGHHGPGPRCHRRRTPRRSRETSRRSPRTASTSRSRPRPDTVHPSRPPGQLRRQQARAHRLTRRMPASQVTHHRQRRNHTRHADPLPHNRKSKDRHTASPLNGQTAREDPWPAQ